MIIIEQVKNSSRLHMALLILAAALVFGNTLSFDFVYDDIPLVLKNSNYFDQNFRAVLLAPGNGLEYLPLRDLSYMMDFALWGDQAYGFHLTNLVLYVLTVPIIYLLSCELLNRFRGLRDLPVPLVAFLITLLYTVHPLNSEPVSFIMCRNVLLSGLFFYLSCHLFLKSIRSASSRRPVFYALSLVCFAAALLSKATTIILPLALVIMAAFGRERAPKDFLMTIPHFVLSGVAFLLFRKIAADSNIIGVEHSMAFGAYKLLPKIAVAVQIPFFYIQKLLLPTGLSVDYSIQFSREFLKPGPILSSLLLLSSGLAVFIVRRTYPYLSFALLWFLVTLLPLLNFFLTIPVVADRYTYLSSYGFFLALTIALFSIFKRNWKLPAGLLFVAALILSIASAKRSAVWSTEKDLWLATMENSANSKETYASLGRIYYEEGNYEKAFELFDDLEKASPSVITPDFYRALKQFNEGNYQGAIDILESALDYKNETVDALYLLAGAYDLSGETEKAIENYLKTIRARDVDIAGKKNHAEGRLEALKKSLAPRFDALRQNVQASGGDMNARIALALALDNAGIYDEALEHYSLIEGAGVTNWALYYNMANVFKKTGDHEKAVAYYNKTLSINSSDANVHNNLGLTLKKLGRYETAIAAFKRAIEVDRNFGYAPFNLAVLYYNTGQKQEAIHYLTYTQDRFPELAVRVKLYLDALQ